MADHHSVLNQGEGRVQLYKIHAHQEHFSEIQLANDVVANKLYGLLRFRHCARYKSADATAYLQSKAREHYLQNESCDCCSHFHRMGLPISGS